MKVLIICSNNSGHIAPFIVEQAESLMQLGIKVDYFTIEGKGWKGYLVNRKHLMDKIGLFEPQLIHAHYGLSGLLANMQRRIPVVTTYHGSDINNKKVYRLSKISIKLSAFNIFVSKKITPISPKGAFKRALIPCGVDIAFFKPIEKSEAREKLYLGTEKKIILFAGAFNNKVKNEALAQEAVSLIPNTTLLELKGYTREQVVWLMNAVDAVLMTSFTEGSPQFIKEAMACNCPVVSVPVGDVSEIIQGIEGCYLCSYESPDVSEKLKNALDFGKRTEGRKRIVDMGLDSETVARRIVEIYQKVVNDK